MENLTARSFKLASCQATVFTTPGEVGTAVLVEEFVPKWRKWFDGEPVVLPDIHGLPDETPRAILKSSSGEWSCEISPVRLNLRRRTLEAHSDAFLSCFAADATSFLADYSDISKAHAGRLAIVVNWYAEHAKPALFLASHFCKERWLSAPLNRPESFELHAHKTYSLTSQFTVNSWVRSRSATLLSFNNAPVVSVEQDLNTLAKDLGTRRFSKQECAAFLDAAAQELPKILALYFPEGNP